MSNATIGATVGASFGCAWGIVGSLGLPRHFRTPSMIFAVAISLALIIALVVHPSRLASRKLRGAIYGGAIALEVIAIVGGSVLLQPPRLQPFILPFIGFVVGLHFIGLWKATDLPLFLWIAAAMCAVCAVAAFLPTGSDAGVNMRIAVTGIGSALVLWAAGLFTVLH
jgi:hypothetical protein